MSDILSNLESNDKDVVDNAKQTLRDLFKTVNEPWLVNGLYDLYLSTNNTQYMNILVNIKEPHHTFLFDKIQGSLKSQNMELKIRGLTLIGHVARSQPTWLYKLHEHSLLPEILLLLKNEVELLPLISALLVLIVLLPMIPIQMSAHLNQIFEIFSRLAAWDNPGKRVENQMLHLQVAMYTLFTRLYGMYPCNLLDYLKSQYKDRNNPVFVHTIKPMLLTVRMHPSIVTTSKDAEKTTERWKKMEVHDVIVECERFSLDLSDRCPHDVCQSSGFRSRSGTTNSAAEPSFDLQNLKKVSSMLTNTENNYFTPSSMFPVTETVATNIPQTHIQAYFPSQEGTSPPEAAIEATPETTPIRDLQSMPAKPQPLNSNIARAITSFGSKNRAGSLNTTPNHSQPSSPMRKDNVQFNFENRSSSALVIAKNQKFQRLIIDRAQVIENFDQTKHKPPPTSPLKIIADKHSFYHRSESPISQEDEEVCSIVSRSEPMKRTLARCNSCSQEDSTDNYEDQEHGSPCTEGGIHIPNSKSMNNFARDIQRLRYHSLCNTEADNDISNSPVDLVPYTTVRHASSCPDMKKSVVVPSKENRNKTLDETDEDENVSVNGVETASKTAKVLQTSTTQTENFWPMPYELLFLSIFPSLENNDIKPSPAPSPAPLNFFHEKYQPTIYEILDKHIETAVCCNDEKDHKNCKEQLLLLHQVLLFERHRRETHAYRNRRLLADARSTRLLEECNSALRDQVHLHQREIENLNYKLSDLKRERSDEDKKLFTTIQYWEAQYNLLQTNHTLLKEKNEILEQDYKDIKLKCSSLEVEKQQTESSLLDTVAEVHLAREQAWAGEKGRSELEQANKELLLIGELHLRYQEKLSKLSSTRQFEVELEQLKEVYNHEVKHLNVQLESKIISLEACQARISDLEQIIIQNEEIIATQKRCIYDLAEEDQMKIDAIESKYQAQHSINRALEEKILELRQKNDLIMKRSVHSPDTSSCHEVNVTTTDRTTGVSAHSSPLSASLASSEGSMAFHDVREVKNLQTLVDQKELTGKVQQDEGEFEVEARASSSAKND